MEDSKKNNQYYKFQMKVFNDKDGDKEGMYGIYSVQDLNIKLIQLCFEKGVIIINSYENDISKQQTHEKFESELKEGNIVVVHFGKWLIGIAEITEAPQKFDYQTAIYNEYLKKIAPLEKKDIPEHKLKYYKNVNWLYKYENFDKFEGLLVLNKKIDLIDASMSLCLQSTFSKILDKNTINNVEKLVEMAKSGKNLANEEKKIKKQISGVNTLVYTLLIILLWGYLLNINYLTDILDLYIFKGSYYSKLFIVIVLLVLSAFIIIFIPKLFNLDIQKFPIFSNLIKSLGLQEADNDDWREIEGMIKKKS